MQQINTSRKDEHRSPVTSKCSGKTAKQQQRKSTTYYTKHSRLADDLSSTAAALVFYLPFVARCTPPARYVRPAVDTLRLASDAHGLTDAIALALETEVS